MRYFRFKESHGAARPSQCSFPAKYYGPASLHAMGENRRDAVLSAMTATPAESVHPVISSRIFLRSLYIILVPRSPDSDGTGSSSERAFLTAGCLQAQHRKGGTNRPQLRGSYCRMSLLSLTSRQAHRLCLPGY